MHTPGGRALFVARPLRITNAAVLGEGAMGAQTRDRAAFVARLAEAAPDAARAQLIAELERLP